MDTALVETPPQEVRIIELIRLPAGVSWPVESPRLALIGELNGLLDDGVTWEDAEWQ
ncbi:MAG: hypothetical protein AB7V46_08965 [Thermomicrobiales bacterium]